MASILNSKKAIRDYGYSSDKRKRRHQHRVIATQLLSSGGFFNGMSAVRSTFWCVTQWHLNNARYLGR